MRSDAEKPGRARLRPLKKDETELWAGVTRTIRPLKPRKPADVPRVRQTVEPSTAKPAPRTPVTPAPPRPTPPPLAGFDRRLKRRIARGAADIDDRLDLHGLGEQRAHDALIAFLRRATANQARVVLVITGKGMQPASAGGQRGVLRRQVPHWLASQPLRAHVLSFEQAHVGHGGEGALYVRLRRSLRPRSGDF